MDLQTTVAIGIGLLFAQQWWFAQRHGASSWRRRKAVEQWCEKLEQRIKRLEDQRDKSVVAATDRVDEMEAGREKDLQRLNEELQDPKHVRLAVQQEIDAWLARDFERERDERIARLEAECERACATLRGRIWWLQALSAVHLGEA